MIANNQIATTPKPSQALTLALDFWRKGKWLILSGLSWVGIWIFVKIVTNIGASATDDTKYFMLFMTMLFETVIIGAIGSIQVDDSKKGAGFPQRLLLLPMSTARLVFWQALFGIAALACIHLVSTIAIDFYFGNIGSPIEPILYLAAVYVWGMAIIWSFPGMSTLRLILIIGLAFCLIWWLDIHYSPSVLRDGGFNAQGNRLFGPGNWNLLHIGKWQLLPIIGLGYAVAVWGVGMARRGEGRLHGIQARLMAWLESLSPSRHRKFRSPQSAQFWYEFRQKGWAMPGAIATLILILIPIMIYNKASLPDYLAIPIIIFWMLPLGALGFGLYLGQCAKGGLRGDLAGRLDTFRATRPLKDSEISGALLKSALASLALTWSVIAIFILAIAVLGYIVGNTDNMISQLEFSNGDDWLIIPLILCLCFVHWALMSAVALTIMTGRVKACATVLLTATAILLITVLGVALDLWSNYVLVFEAVAACLAIGIISLAAIMLARKRGLILWKTTGFGIALWAIMATAILLWTIWNPAHLPLVANLLLWGLCLGVGNIGLGPWAIAWNRHR